MTNDEMFAAINALGDASLRMRAPEDWFVSQRVEVKRGNMLSGRYGNGRTPQEAIEDHFNILTSVSPPECVVLDAYGDNRRELRWAGYMWKDVA